MNETPGKPGRPGPGTDREARLKAALKANLARRKAQARARKTASEERKPPEK